MKRIIIVLILALFFVGCGDQTKEGDRGLDLVRNIDSLEKKAFSADRAIDLKVAGDLVSAYCDFADANPDDAMTPEYLFKAVDVSMNLNEPQRTISIIDKLVKDYPDYKNTHRALFAKAFIFETRYNNLEMAKQLYEQYLEMYPDGELAGDCRASIENLGLSPEELVKKFESQ